MSIDDEPKSFDEMSDAEAGQFLHEFLATEGKILHETIRLKHEAGQDFDIGREYLLSYFKEFDPIVRPKYRPWGDRLPEYLKELPMHAKGESYYDHDSNMCLLRMGYYFGECLLKEFPGLRWGIADRGYAHSGQPAVIGFPHDDQCPVVHICSTVMKRIDSRELGFGEFLNTLDAWREKMI
ncbi:hypothetical protein K3X44_15435 (plasmid) [Aliiroseovarius crassostreae]|uniref:hypothetical protein n=1 Tax=Aliiroseovarius crassostreae TaxID=154981 RepID=UPI00220C6380|nr:hypothetical protein [Aliiroseovarius crassostreae]UWQ03512.1 hypothetical protein K3X44_15435 [Aliiroseovarius crassostreae]